MRILCPSREKREREERDREREKNEGLKSCRISLRESNEGVTSPEEDLELRNTTLPSFVD